MIGLKMRVVGSGKLWEEHPQISIFNKQQLIE